MVGEGSRKPRLGFTYRAPPLLPLLRSRVQGDLLALLYLRPDREYSLTEAAARIGASVKAVHQEASRLVDAGLLVDRRLGNLRLLRAATDTPLSRPLTDLLAVTYGPRATKASPDQYRTMSTFRSSAPSASAGPGQP